MTWSYIVNIQKIKQPKLPLVIIKIINILLRGIVYKVDNVYDITDLSVENEADD